MNTLTMYDSVDADSLPDNNGDLTIVYAGYVDHKGNSYERIAQRFPRNPRLSIAVNASNRANALDVEKGAALATEMIGWAENEHAHGAVLPLIYTALTNWPHYQALFSDARVEVGWWIAEWELNNGAADFPIPGAWGHQYWSTPGWDKSVVSNVLPGVYDLRPKPPVPVPPKPPVQPTKKGRDMIIIREASPNEPTEIGTETIIGNLYTPVHLTSAANVAAISHALATGEYANVTEPDFSALIQAATPTGATTSVPNLGDPVATAPLSDLPAPTVGA